MKRIRMIEGYYKVTPLGDGLFKLKSTDNKRPYQGLWELEKAESGVHHYKKRRGSR